MAFKYYKRDLDDMRGIWKDSSDGTLFKPYSTPNMENRVKTVAIHPKRVLGWITVVLALTVCIAVIRAVNDGIPLTIDNFWQFLDSFNVFANFGRKIRLPDIPDWLGSIPLIGRLINWAIDLVNAFWTLGTLLWNVLYVIIKLYLWALFGISL